MSLVNVYLNETPLTSTKNKFLEKDSYINIFKESNLFKRKLKNELFSPQKCLTQNRFLLDDPFLKKEKKKKKKCKSVYLMKSKRSKSRSKETFQSDSRYIRRNRPRSELLESSECCTFGSAILDSEMIEEKTPGSFGGFTFGSAGTNRSFQGVRFGAAPASVFSFQDCCDYPMRSSKKMPPLKLSENVLEKVITEMPTYNLETINLYEEGEFEFSSFSPDLNSENFFANAKRKKIQLLNIVSMALMFRPNLKDDADNYRISLLKSIHDVRLIEPEFILKVALYARQELQIRVVSNFLLSYAAFHYETRIYLEKYFEASVVLPSDWIQVAEYFQVLNCGQNKRPFPAALRRVMRKSFHKFDKYQLAKYNKIKTKKKQNIEEVSAGKLEMMNSDGNISSAINKTFTLKELIRSLHIDSPSEFVMCLLEKKYPKNQEEFMSSGLPGVWDPEKSGKRMKLPTPETWETCVSAYGNKPDVWESLIDNQKLPYMAMLRNLKNLILSGISSSHHKKIIENLQNKKYVINSRQLPMQYFEAYKVLRNLQEMIENEDLSFKSTSLEQMPIWKRLQFQKLKSKIQNIPASIVEEYKSAICKALEISSRNNLHPIPGKTLIVCEISPDTFRSQAKFKNCETFIMMALMTSKACEDCKMCIFSRFKEMETITLKEDQKFFDVLMKTCGEYEKLLTVRDYSDIDYVSEMEMMLNSFLRSQSMLSLKLDHLIFLQMSDSMETEWVDRMDTMEGAISSFLHKYRQLVNSEMLYTNVSFKLRNTSFSERCISDKDAYICGSSSSLIKFIAERSTGGQLFYVENIDVKYKLPEISESKCSIPVPNQTAMSASAEISDSFTPMHLNYKTPKWRTLRIFISSPFKDMVSERDLLIRYVFPELKKRAATVFAKIVEVDLRWGITEADSSTKRAAEICLREAQKADIFVGIIGERYGSVYNFEPPDAADLDWVKECPTGLSITELEMYAAALRNPQESHGRSFFYFRDNSFLSHVPKKWTGHFMAEDFQSKAKVETLKQKIRSENFKILDGYPCHWAGICDNKPVLAGLDVLGNRVLDDLWKAVQEIQKTESYQDNLSEVEIHEQNLIESRKFFIDQKNFSRDSVAKKIDLKHGIFVIYGTAGCGKTTFLVNLLPCLKKFAVMKFFIGISSRSRDLSYIIQYLCKRTCQELGNSVSLPPLPDDIVSYFPDFLIEASNCCGGREIIFIIDGLDRLEENDQRLDWLPLNLPKKIKVICSASQSSLAFKVLCERDNVSFFEMSPLLLPEREQIVRNYLSYYRKVLDESAFSNKMLKIVTKKDSSNPFYLQIVCDFLRIYGSFDSLESMLQNIPSSIDMFFQEIILQMENEFGCILIQTILILLCITKEGLEDADLHYILSFAKCLNDLKAVPPFNELKEKIGKLEPENLLCQVKYCSLMSTINTFAYGQLRQESFSLVGTEFEKAARKFYRNRNYTSHSKSLHCILAAYYHNVCDVTNDGTYKLRSECAFRSLLYHMFYGGLYKELSDLLCNVAFLKAVFLANADSDLLVYYSSLLCDILPSDQKLSREIDCSNLSSFYSFVSRNFHIFHQSPDLLIQQALNEMSSLLDLKKYRKNCYLLENLSRANTMDYRLATLSGFSKNITASVGKNLTDIVALGTEDGYLKILDLTTHKVFRTIKAHASEITYLCCIGRNRMCVSSVDGTLSIWNTEDFSRISVLYGHRHNVTCCCSDPAGYILYSSGWDNSVRLWSVEDGRSITIIEDFRCPVNWIDHHPQKQQIACGLWNGSIEIWDTLSIQRKTIMSSLNGSVQSLAYTQDGVNIVSSYINAEITIWSSEEGLKMSCLKGHTLPVKTFTSLLTDSIVISGSEDSTLKVWSTAHRSEFTNITEAKFCPINLMEFMSENLLAVAFQNSEIWIFDINNGASICKLDLDMNVASVFCKYSSTNINSEGFENYWSERYLVFGTTSGKLMLGDVLDCSVSTVLELPSKIAAAIHNCKIIVCGTSEGDIGMYYSSKKLFKIVHVAHKGFIGTFSLTEQNETLYLLSSGNDNVMKLWKIEWNDFELILQNEFVSKHRDAITCSLFHSPLSTPSSLNFLTGSYDNNVMLWENESVKVFQGLHCSVLKITCSGDYILGCGNDGALVMWHKNGAILTTIPGINQSSAILTFHVSGGDSGEFGVTLAYVDLDGSIKINKPFQLSYYCSFDGHSKPITSCCATLSNEIVSCSLDGSVNLWKVPIDMFDGHFTHESCITGLVLSNSFNIAVSSDANGNLLLWKLNLESSTSPLTYAGKKKYEQGFIKRLSWLPNQRIACVVENGEKSFLDIIQFNDSSQKSALCLQVTKSYTFESEVSSFDSCDQTDRIVVGFKSGDVMYISPETKQLHRMSMDWILGLCFYERSHPSDRFFVSYVDGRVKSFSVSSFLSSKDTSPDPIKTYESPDAYESSKFTSIMCYAGEFVCCGDSDGILRIYSNSSLKFIEKVHDSLVSGMCVIDSYLFTSSLDKTVKGWNLKSFKQVCQFNSSTPVSCLSSAQKSPKESGQHSNFLIIGTVSGNVHLLQFHSK